MMLHIQELTDKLLAAGMTADMEWLDVRESHIRALAHVCGVDLEKDHKAAQNFLTELTTLLERYQSPSSAP
jgi:hypothetical protein